MKYKQLAPGLELSVLSLGSYHTYDRMQHEDIVELLSLARNSGINFFDVAYYWSANPKISRESDTDIRFGAARVDAGYQRQNYFHAQKVWFGEGRPSFKSQLEVALPRVQIDYADCLIYNASGAYFYGQTVDLEKIVAEVEEALGSGLAKHWAIDVISADELNRLCALAERNGLPLPLYLQTPYTIVARDWVESDEMVQAMSRWNVALQPNNVLGFGLLAGKDPAKSGRPMGPRHLTQHVDKIYSQLSQEARAMGATPAQLSIAFALANKLTASVLFGASSVEQLRENLGAVDLVERFGADRIRQAGGRIAQDPEQVLSTGEPFIDVSSILPQENA